VLKSRVRRWRETFAGGLLLGGLVLRGLVLGGLAVAREILPPRGMVFGRWRPAIARCGIAEREVQGAARVAVGRPDWSG
jgi:hypothetical protein